MFGKEGILNKAVRKFTGMGDKLKAPKGGPPEGTKKVGRLRQIASKASTHIKTSKSIINNRTICDIVNLNKEKTVEELATMISGKVITKGSVEYAKGIIKN